MKKSYGSRILKGDVIHIKKMNANIKRLIIYALLFLGAIVAAVGVYMYILYGLSGKIVIGTGIAIMCAGGVYEILFLRCPYCRKQLPLYLMSGDYCPRCGENVNK